MSDLATTEKAESNEVETERERQPCPRNPDEGYVDTRSERQQWLEYVLLCLCNVAWTVDAAILPTFFREFQTLFHVSETELSLLSTAKGWVAAVFAFPCGFMSELLPRPKLIGLGMICWAVGLALCAAAWTFEMLFVGRLLNGIGLGIVQPLLLSLVADTNRPSRRGLAFGSMFFAGSVSNTVFCLYATKYAADSILGVAGWRISVATVAACSLVLGFLMICCVGEPHQDLLAERRSEHKTLLSVFTKNVPKVLSLFKYPTFVLILLQGAPGTIPQTVFPYFTQWLELSCFTHTETADILAAFGWGCSFSNLLSGVLLNAVAKRFPDHGPPTIAIFSVASGVPYLVVLFFVLPKPDALGHGAGVILSYYLTFFTFGLVSAMCGTVNEKIFTDVVPSSLYSYVFAVDQFIDNGFGSLAGLSVGFLTDREFHYDADKASKGACDAEDAVKLGLGMFSVCNVGWFICFGIYLRMHWTYPDDRRRQLNLQGQGGSCVDTEEAREVELKDTVHLRSVIGKSTAVE